MAADTGAFMDAIKIDGAAVVGLGDGGIIALLLAYSRPELVSRLVVSGANNNPGGLAAIEGELERMTPEEFLAGVRPLEMCPGSRCTAVSLPITDSRSSERSLK